MIVRELIEQLNLLPQDADVYLIQDGEPRSEAEFVYVSNGGDVMIHRYNDLVYTVEHAPIGHTTGIYKTPKRP